MTLSVKVEKITDIDILQWAYSMTIDSSAYSIAKEAEGMVFDETEEKCAGGICGL
jgi:hypothetical protein